MSNLKNAKGSSLKEVAFCPLCSSTRQEYKLHDFEQNRFVECQNCGLVFQNPRKTAEYGESYWEERADPDGKIRVQSTEREWKIRNQYKNEIAFVNKLKPGKILDAGCGFGFFLSAIDGRWGKYGVEESKYCAGFVRKNYPDISITCGSLTNCPFEKDFFDVIYCFHVMEHVGNPHEIVKEFRRTIKTSGILIISTPNISSFCARRFRGNYRLLGSPHIVLYSPATLERLLTAYNFKIFSRRYPFFRTDYFTLKNLLRLSDTRKISPPFYGNTMTFYARAVK